MRHDAKKTAGNFASRQENGTAMRKDGTTQRKRLESLRRDRKAGLTTEKDVTTQGKQPETLRRDIKIYFKVSKIYFKVPKSV